AKYGNRLSRSTPHHFSSVFAYDASRSHRSCYNFSTIPPHWLHDVRDYLDESLLQHWIGRTADNNLHLLGWQSYVKYIVFVPPLPLNLLDLGHRITPKIQNVD
ncbi:hypothetical protein J6590_050904, partial [Homalodisca vitripennis]